MIHVSTYRVTSDRWRRTWQAEWEGCQRAPRAWTERGVERKAARWIRSPPLGRWIHDRTEPW